MTRRSETFHVAVVTFWIVGRLAGAAVARHGRWRAGQGDVRITCPMTIGGSFQAKTTALSGSLTPGASHPPSYDGSLAVDLRTLDTGISLRNEHMREKYLEVDKAPGYDKATLSEIDLKGLNPGRARRARDRSPDR